MSKLLPTVNWVTFLAIRSSGHRKTYHLMEMVYVRLSSSKSGRHNQVAWAGVFHSCDINPWPLSFCHISSLMGVSYYQLKEGREAQSWSTDRKAICWDKLELSLAASHFYLAVSLDIGKRKYTPEAELQVLHLVVHFFCVEWCPEVWIYPIHGWLITVLLDVQRPGKK